jgi:secreted PhoX family phosphatase
MDRRQFSAAALASFAFPGLAACAQAQAQAEDYLNQAEGYGPLQPDPAGMFDLPAGFGYRIVSQAGEAMDDGFAAPGHFDGMACFRLDRRRSPWSATTSSTRPSGDRADRRAGAPAGAAGRRALLRARQ